MAHGNDRTALFPLDGADSNSTASPGVPSYSSSMTTGALARGDAAARSAPDSTRNDACQAPPPSDGVSTVAHRLVTTRLPAGHPTVGWAVFRSRCPSPPTVRSRDVIDPCRSWFGPRLIALLAVAMVLPTAPAAATPPMHATPPAHFDLQAHRGGIALTVESTLQGFATALELGVSTLELDVQITEDGHAVVTHDRQVSGAKCRDTGPAFPDDPEYPYVGDFVVGLTLAQVRTLDCGSQQLPAYPEQNLAPGARMPLLSEVFDLVDAYRARDVMLNVETKVEAAAPHETAPREQFVQVVVEEIRRAKMLNQVMIQSFDWGALMRVREVEPRLPIVALTNGDFLEVGQPGASVWLGGIDIDDFDGDLVAAVDSFGADALSPVHGTPQGGRVTDDGYTPFTTPELVADAHEAGIAVIPWTVNDRPTVQSLIDAGVDGLITDRPDLLREVMADNGFVLPQPRRRVPAHAR